MNGSAYSADSGSIESNGKTILVAHVFPTGTGYHLGWNATSESAGIHGRTMPVTVESFPGKPEKHTIVFFTVSARPATYGHHLVPSEYDLLEKYKALNHDCLQAYGEGEIGVAELLARLKHLE